MSKNTDLTTLLGNPKKAINSMFLPFLLAAAVVQINQFVDTYWVSGLGATPSSAVSTITPIYGLMMCAGLGIGVGATTTIAYRLGQGEKEIANHLACQSLSLGIIFAIIGSLLAAVFVNPAIDLMGAQSIREECILYLVPFILLSPILLLESILGSILRAEGAAKKSTIVQVTAAVFNMIIDPILIYGLNMGITGAGLSTCVAALLSLCIGLSWYARGKMNLQFNLRDLKPDREVMNEALEIGGPRTVQSLVSNATDFIQRIFLIFCGGTNAVMFYNYAWRYIGLVELPSGALDTSMVPVASAAHGQNDCGKMKMAILYALKMSVLCSLIFLGVLFFLADPLISILTYEESMNALKDSFVWTLKISALLLPFSAMMGIGNSILQSLKRSRISMNYYFLWGFLKLALYAVACLYSFEAIIYSMVLIHVFGGLCLMYLANKEFSRKFPGNNLLALYKNPKH